MVYIENLIFTDCNLFNFANERKNYDFLPPTLFHNDSYPLKIHHLVNDLFFAEKVANGILLVSINWQIRFVLFLIVFFDVSIANFLR